MTNKRQDQVHEGRAKFQAARRKRQERMICRSVSDAVQNSNYIGRGRYCPRCLTILELGIYEREPNIAVENPARVRLHEFQMMMAAT